MCIKSCVVGNYKFGIRGKKVKCTKKLTHTHTAMPPPRLLPAVSAAFAPLASVAGGDIDTAAFAEACTSVLPLFDCLGEREREERGGGKEEERGCCLPPQGAFPNRRAPPTPSPAPRSMRQREQNHSTRALGGEREEGATQRDTLTPSCCPCPPPPSAPRLRLLLCQDRAGDQGERRMKHDR